MEKMTILKMLERTVVTISKSDVKRIYLVSTDGEVVEAKIIGRSDSENREMEFPVGSKCHFCEVVRQLFHGSL